VRLPLPNPFALLTRATALLTGAEALLAEVRRLLDRIESTRADAGVVIAAVDETRERADLLLEAAQGPLERLLPTLERLLPTLERLAETTDPREVDAMVGLIDRLPLIASRVEADVLPMLQTLSSVAPDLHDLLDVSRELNEMLAKLPGMGRIKKRVDEEQELAGATPR